MPYTQNTSYELTPLVSYNNNSTPVLYLNLDYYSKTTPSIKGDFIHTYKYVSNYYHSEGSCAQWYKLRTYDPSVKRWSGYVYGIAQASLPGSSVTKTAVGPYGYDFDSGKQSELSDAARRQVNSKILEGFPSWDVLTDIAEVKETASLIHEAGEFLAKFTLGVVKRDPKAILRAFGIKPTVRKATRLRKRLSQLSSGTSNFGIMSSLWLKYRYGVMPLLYSIHDAINAFSKPKWADNVMNVYHGFSSNSWSKTVDLSSNGWPTYTATLKYNRSGIAHIIAYVSYVSGIKARLNANSAVSLLRTGYELVPFSFVVDWFYDIGSWINSLNLGSIVDSNSWACLSERATAHEQVTMSACSVPGQGIELQVLGFSGTSAVATCEYFERTPTGFSSVPPKLGWGVSNLKRSVDSLFLSVSRARRLL